MVALAFHGGTALRLLYRIPRYSEDLDFALERNASDFDLRSHMRAIRSLFAAETYDVSLRVNSQRVVQSAVIRFTGLLHELGVSPHRDQVLAVKIEVDTRPPDGAGLAITTVRRHILLRLQHHDQASLLAGKLHAILQRPFVKGRDVFDLLWYLSDPEWPNPNMPMLNNTLSQTGWAGGELRENSWRQVIRERLAAVSWPQIVQDVRPFLEPGGLLQVTRENLDSVLGRGSARAGGDR